MSSHGKCGGHGCPQADGGGERELKRINRELKEMGPQADGVRIQVSINDERLLIKDGVHTENTEVTRKSASGRCGRTAIVINWTAIKRKNCLSTDDTDGHGWMSAGGQRGTSFD